MLPFLLCFSQWQSLHNACKLLLSNASLSRSHMSSVLIKLII
nr:MAG TPA: hypothetical protein [Caudoviricetes sp.]